MLYIDIQLQTDTQMKAVYPSLFVHSFAYTHAVQLYTNETTDK